MVLWYPWYPKRGADGLLERCLAARGPAICKHRLVQVRGSRNELRMIGCLVVPELQADRFASRLRSAPQPRRALPVADDCRRLRKTFETSRDSALVAKLPAQSER